MIHSDQDKLAADGGERRFRRAHPLAHHNFLPLFVLLSQVLLTLIYTLDPCQTMTSALEQNGAPPSPALPLLSPQPGPSTPTAALSPRSSLDDAEDRSARLEQELANARQEKEVLGNQYRSLLGKLTAMRKSLGDKLREDAVGRIFQWPLRLVLVLTLAFRRSSIDEKRPSII